MQRDFTQADRLLERYTGLKKRWSPTLADGIAIDGESLDFWTDLWKLIQIQPIWEESRTLNALPSNSSDIGDILVTGGTSQQHLKKSTRDLEWLEEKGQCMDNIRDGLSANPDAGRGAFATRRIAKGGLVGPAPLIHVPDDSVLDMYRPTLNKDKHGKVHTDRSGPKHSQLLLNYCFGHTESTLLLCTYGLLTMLINHSKGNANTKIQWSETMRHKEWMNQSIAEWGDEHHTGLSFDFVALRDIEEGEEILIDYGEAWEISWQDHVLNFFPRENYVPGYELNNMTDLKIRTVEERPYELDGVRLWCRGWYRKTTRGTGKGDSRCRVLKRTGGDRYRYMVQLMEVDDNGKKEKTLFSFGQVLWDVPSDAFYFEDMPYQRDHHEFWSFRHPMMIPDSIFPEIWKNKDI
jgi:hypothetical protein